MLVAQMVKRLSTMRETRVRALGWEDPWRRKWLSTPVLLPGKSHGQKSLVGYSLWGRKESDSTERLHFHSSLEKTSLTTPSPHDELTAPSHVLLLPHPLASRAASQLENHVLMCAVLFFVSLGLCCSSQAFLLAESRGYSCLPCAGFSSRWLPFLWSTGSRARAQELRCEG